VFSETASARHTNNGKQWNKKDNRAAVIKLISEGRMKGYLAYSDNRPIGWCNVNDRSNYQALKKIYQIDVDPNEKVCSIVCFLINPDFRRKGISKILLEKIIDDYSNQDYDYLEAYPDKDGRSCEKNYKGHLSLYENNDFKIIAEHDNNYIVRKTLK
jgi:ribosomal protein S18 acetylase RimI-like enzyme